MNKLTHGSLFSGIGGFEKGADLAQIKTIWNCEYEKFNRQILKQHWNDTQQYQDIRHLSHPRYVDIISGGFPCQDISVAGAMEGINGNRSSLWHEMFRICWEVRPKYIIIENSPALTIRGFEQVLCDLSKIGYDAEWQCISNFAFGYPHKRERIYVVAYSNEVRLQSNICEGGSLKSIFRKWSPDPDNGFALSKRIYEMPAHSNIRNDDGFKHWTHRVAAVGNSVNPTIAYYLFECIKHWENQQKKK